VRRDVARPPSSRGENGDGVVDGERRLVCLQQHIEALERARTGT
jgi:hypothetical protein